jgi:hypothetical protein
MSKRIFLGSILLGFGLNGMIGTSNWDYNLQNRGLIYCAVENAGNTKGYSECVESSQEDMPTNKLNAMSFTSLSVFVVGVYILTNRKRE